MFPSIILLAVDIPHGMFIDSRVTLGYFYPYSMFVLHNYLEINNIRIGLFLALHQ